MISKKILLLSFIPVLTVAYISFFALAVFGFFIERSVRLWRQSKVIVPPSLIPLLALFVLLPLSNLEQRHLRLLYLSFTASLVFLTIAGGWVGYIRLYQRILPTIGLVRDPGNENHF